MDDGKSTPANSHAEDSHLASGGRKPPVASQQHRLVTATGGLRPPLDLLRLRHKPPAAPKIPGRNTAVRPPRFGLFTEPRTIRQLRKPKVRLHPGALSEVVHGENVQPPHRENQEH